MKPSLIPTVSVNLSLLNTSIIVMFFITKSHFIAFVEALIVFINNSFFKISSPCTNILLLFLDYDFN